MLKAMKNIKDLTSDAAAIFVDSGGILLKPDNQLIKEICKLPNLKDEDLDKALYIHGKVGAGLGPGDDDDAFVFNFLISASIPEYIVKTNFSALREVLLFMPWVPRELKNTKSALNKLKKIVNKIIIVSNTEYGGAEELLAKLKVCQIGDGDGVSVTGVIDSAVIGIHKPDPEIYKYTANLFDLPIEKCIHIGDSVRNDVNSMNEAGGIGIHFCPYSVCQDASHYHIKSIMDLIPS
jgi:phosphoglycolate phosphatase-like HAD superfamily hydrolase